MGTRDIVINIRFLLTMVANFGSSRVWSMALRFTCSEGWRWHTKSHTHHSIVLNRFVWVASPHSNAKLDQIPLVRSTNTFCLHHQLTRFDEVWNEATRRVVRSEKWDQLVGYRSARHWKMTLQKRRTLHEFSSLSLTPFWQHAWGFKTHD